MTDLSKVDDAWGELLGDDDADAPPVPAAAEPLPPPPGFEGSSATSPRSESVIESLEALFKRQSVDALEREPDSGVFLTELAEMVRASSKSHVTPPKEEAAAASEERDPDSAESLALARQAAPEAPTSVPAMQVERRFAHEPVASFVDDEQPMRPNRQRMVWLGGAAVLVTAAIVGVVTLGGGGREDRSASAAASAASNPAARESTKPAAKTDAPTPPPAAESDAAAPSAAKADAPAAVPAKADDAVPSPSEPDDAKADPPSEAKADAPAPSSSSSLAADDEAYRRAVEEHSKLGTPESLAAKIIAACRVVDGPTARAGFRRLAPTSLRMQAMEACEASGVSVRANVEGFTPAELIKRARRALDGGDANTALETARESNRMKRSEAAVFVMALAACALDDGDEAKRLRRHVDGTDRPELDAACKRKGIDLASEPTE